MNIFKKIFGKKKKVEEEKKQESWFNDQSNHYDPKTGTPNQEAYISPESIVIGLSKSNQ
ncbi:MAG: hypothetical protein IKB28_01360 [Clostridia bacterium]|nr:hypothetical protein [Clostridia bacterium]